MSGKNATKEIKTNLKAVENKKGSCEEHLVGKLIHQGTEKRKNEFEKNSK